jgi:hypothetical protein
MTSSVTIIKSSFSKRKIQKLLDFSRPKSLKLTADYKVREVSTYAFRGECKFLFNIKTGKCKFDILICYGSGKGEYSYPQLVERLKKEEKLGYLSNFTLDSIEAAFIYVASHECRHLLQIQKGWFGWRNARQTKFNKRWAETDADLYAIRKLKEWRRLCKKTG